MIVLSLFDGISCARVALDRAGLSVRKYYSAEIEKNAIKISQKNYPDIVRLGDVRQIHLLPDTIDLLIGGSPCTDLSIAKKDRKGLEGDQSCLFWEYVRILRETKPKWFVLENVASMPKKDRDTITRELGVEPVLFNASLVSAQSRKRLFWTNIKFDLPEDRGILLKDILQPDAEVDESMIIKTTPYNELPKPKEHEFVQIGYYGATNACGVGGQALRVYSAEGKSTTSGIGLYKLGHIGNTDGQANRVYSIEGKSATLSANGGGLGAKTGLYAVGASIRGNTQTKTPDGIRYSNKLDLRKDEKANALTPTFTNKLALVAIPHIRKLTPIECERLQGLPDNYTEGIAKTHRYKCLGNAFNVDVVAHILSPLRQTNSRTLALQSP